MNYLDLLPLELLHEIAQDSEPAYYALLSYPRFARDITSGTRIDYMVYFGHSVYLHKDITIWRRNGVKHRKHHPAVIRADWDEEWWYNGLLHRDDGPAVIAARGKIWYTRGKKHRDDGPAIIEANGNFGWYQNGELHRDDGPAIIYGNGDKAWYQNGNLHREWGPAVVFADGTLHWYNNGEYKLTIFIAIAAYIYKSLSG